MRHTDPTEGLDDVALLAAIGVGDGAAAAVFVRRYQRSVYGLAVTMCHDLQLAEDIAQQTFERVWRHAGSYDHRRGTARTWTLTITRRLCIDELRTRRPIVSNAEELIQRHAAGIPAVDDCAAASADAQRLQRSLADLPEGQRRAVGLAALGGHTTAEIAEIEQVPLGTAKTRLRQGLLKLRHDAAELGVVHD